MPGELAACVGVASAGALAAVSAEASVSSVAGADSGMLAGSCSVKVLPWPGMLYTEIEPPSSALKSREIDSPRPVPP